MLQDATQEQSCPSTALGEDRVRLTPTSDGTVHLMLFARQTSQDRLESGLRGRSTDYGGSSSKSEYLRQEYTGRVSVLDAGNAQRLIDCLHAAEGRRLQQGRGRY